MQISKRVFQLAKERALFRFSALVRPMLQDADASLSQSLLTKLSAQDEKNLFSARQFLRQEGKPLLARFETLYRDRLDRAMQTMYQDLRLSLDKVNADDLTLIDDDTVNRQLEVDRLLARMREADDADLGRLNLMIAQMHGHDEVKERENPFRPYLIAQALHQVLRELVPEQTIVKVLFNHLSDALANHLAEYYAAIRNVFESSGIQARLLARPGRLVRHQRYIGGSDVLEPLAEEPSPRALPGLHRILELMQNQPAASATQTAGNQASSTQELNELEGGDLQDFVRKIFNQSKQLDLLNSAEAQQAGLSGSGSSDGSDERGVPASDELISRLNQFQQLAAKGQAEAERPLQHQNQLFDIGDQVDAGKASQVERVTIDVVAMLFEFILEDEQIPEGLRRQIGLLQIPFLKAAVLDPALLQRADHPARVLLNRMGSAAVGLDPASPVGQKIAAEMTRIVKKILHEFYDDMSIFPTCLGQLEQALADYFRAADSETSRSVDAIEKAVQVGDRLSGTTDNLQQALLPLRLDKRVSDFITDTWMLVLCREAADIESPANGPYHRLLPELIWSVQPKQSSEERSALIGMLPDLVKRLKNGLLMMHFPEEECHQALDPLVAMHMEVLRGKQSRSGANLFSLDELRKHFSRFSISLDNAQPQSAERQAAAIATALAKDGMSVNLDLTTPEMTPIGSDEEWLGQMQLGICVERWEEGEYQLARLAWIDQNQTLYMFKPEKSTSPAVYSAQALIKALREGSVRLIESAPVFDRAVEAIMLDAQAVRPAR